MISLSNYELGRIRPGLERLLWRTAKFTARRSLLVYSGSLGRLTNFLNRLLWLARFGLRKFAGQTPTRMLAATEVLNMPVYYINMDSRPDRRTGVECELKRVGFRNILRFAAISASPGALGCALSHSTLLAKIVGSEPLIMICEDDVEFLANASAIAETIVEFHENEALDVLCIANNINTPPHRISNLLSITNNTQTTACYVIKARAQPLLHEIFSKSVASIENGVPIRKSALDILWKKLQKGTLFFAIPNSRMARQRASFSDVEGKWVDYGV